MNGTNSLRKHVPRIFVCLCQSAKRERLARRAASDDIYITNRVKVKFTHIHLMNKTRVKVRPQTLARPLVELDKGSMLEPGEFKSLRQPAAAAEQFKASHRSPIM